MQHLAPVSTCSGWAIVALLAGLGCAPPPLPEDEAVAPSVEILYPQLEEGSALCSSFLVVVKSQGFAIGEPGDGSDGHWHLVMDEVGGGSVALGEGALMSDWPSSHSEVLEVDADTSSLDLQTGEYNLMVVLANEQHQMVSDDGYDIIEALRVDDADPDCEGWPSAADSGGSSR